ncbi:MAG: PorT family protein [Prevotellaceae bacterium]|jgi:hypothetical protein|nr:PorT family protein [Prevotellaceae bacterium]
MKKYVLLLIIASVTLPVMAQWPIYYPVQNQRDQHELSVYGIFGSAALWGRYTGNISGSENSFDKLSGGGGVGYTFFFHPQWGITTGAEVFPFSAIVQAQKIVESSSGTYSYGGDTEPLYFNSVLADYEETQRATYIHIPLLLQFQTEGYHKFYVTAGAKVGFAISGNYEAAATSLTTSGHFPESAQTFTGMSHRGFISVPKPVWTGTLDFGLNVSLSVEAGTRWATGAHTAFYTGFYLDCGLLNVVPEKTAGLVHYQPDKPGELIYNSILAAREPATGTVYVEKLNLFSMGIKMRLTFGW